jgi:MFS family permease
MTLERPARAAGTLVAACAAVMVAQMANALPASLNGALQEDLGTSGSQLTWVMAAFMIAVVVFELTFGVLGDLHGRRRLMVGGAMVLAVGSAISVLAPNVQVLWLGAALNGLGAGAMFPASLALVAAVTHTPEARARGIAVWAGFLSLGAVVAPLLGGASAGFGTWRIAFAGVAGLGVVTVVLALALAAESTAAEGRRLDLPGQVTLALGLVLVLYAAVQGPEVGWGSPSIIAAFVLGALLLAAFVAIERRVESPLLDLGLFRNRAFAVASAVAVAGMLSFLGLCFTMSMWLGPVQHQDPALIAVPFLLLQGARLRPDPRGVPPTGPHEFALAAHRRLPADGRWRRPGRAARRDRPEPDAVPPAGRAHRDRLRAHHQLDDRGRHQHRPVAPRRDGERHHQLAA